MSILVALLLASSPFAASGPFVSKPPSGDNQRALVTQQIGPVVVSIEYSSPRVTLKGDDRRGKIWGQLVPYGLGDIGFNNCKMCPWRAGANENTIFTTSNDVKVQGQTLAAGTYALFMIAGKDEFTLIFSRNHSSWGAFSYDPKEDALRVPAKPAKSEYHEWLTYEFTEREPTKATVALKWEDLMIPFTITVENAPALYVAQMKEQLRGEHGFVPDNYQVAIDYCLKNKVGLTDALTWAQRATDSTLGGQENFNTLMMLSRAQAANGQAAQAAQTQEKALADPGAKPLDLHLLGRSLLAEGKKQEAMKIFQINAQRFPDRWPVHVGLMRGYAANGEPQKALEEAQVAVKQAPDEGNRKNLENMIRLLKEGKKID